MLRMEGYTSCESGLRRTVSGKDSGLGAGGLAHQDGSVGVVLLHGRVGAVKEGPI